MNQNILSERIFATKIILQCWMLVFNVKQGETIENNLRILVFYSSKGSARN